MIYSAFALLDNSNSFSFFFDTNTPIPLASNATGPPTSPAHNTVIAFDPVLALTISTLLKIDLSVQTPFPF